MRRCVRWTIDGGTYKHPMSESWTIPVLGAPPIRRPGIVPLGPRHGVDMDYSPYPPHVLDPTVLNRSTFGGYPDTGIVHDPDMGRGWVPPCLAHRAEIEPLPELEAFYGSPTPSRWSIFWCKKL